MVTSGFFNSMNGDRLYNADEMTLYFDGLVSDGVYASVAEAMVVKANTGMEITVGAGRALVKLRWCKNDAELPITLNPADVQYGRYDLIVLRCNLSEAAREITIDIKSGEPAQTPKYPEIVDTETIKEMPLAAVYVKKNATTIYQSDITDLRGSASCPWVTGLIRQVDTSQLFLQYQTAYEAFYKQSTEAFNEYFNGKMAEINAWYATLTETLNVNTQIRKYQSSQEIDAYAKEAGFIYMMIPEYAKGDIVLLHVDGVMFIENTEFAVIGSGDGARVVFAAGSMPNTGSVVTVLVIKSIIGDSISNDIYGNLMLTANGVVGTSIAGNIEILEEE